MEVVAVVALGVLLLAAVTVAGLYLSRQRTLSRRVGSFACAFRDAPGGEPAGSVTAGIAQYATGRLIWWRTLSLAPRPARSWSRSDLVVLDRDPLAETDELGRPLLRVRCGHRGTTFDLTMSEPAFAGLVSWLEAGPRPVGRVV